MAPRRKDRAAIALATATTKAARRAAAVTLGSRTSEAKAAAVRENGLLGGRPKAYRIHHRRLERHLGDNQWVVLEQPYDRAAREALRRLTT